MIVTLSQRSSERWDLGVERADRLDLVAEELDPDRLGGVGREDVEDAAAEAELAGDLDDLGPRHPPLQQPGRQLLDGQGVAHTDPPRHPHQDLAPRHGLQQRLDGASRPDGAASRRPAG